MAFAKAGMRKRRNDEAPIDGLGEIMTVFSRADGRYSSISKTWVAAENQIAVGKA